MSNTSSKSGSSNSQKVFGRSYPDIKITDTSNNTSRGSSLISKPKEDVNVKYTNEPLRMRLEYKEGTEDTKFKLKKKKIYQSKSHPWIPTPEMLTIREFIVKIQKECPNADIEILPQSCTDECFEFSINEKMIYSVKTLKDWPNFDEIYEIVYWMYRGKTFMHIYMCTYMTAIDVGAASQVMGSKPTTMMIYDRKHTPLYKRAMLSCSVM